MTGGLKPLRPLARSMVEALNPRARKVAFGDATPHIKICNGLRQELVIHLESLQAQIRKSKDPETRA